MILLGALIVGVLALPPAPDVDHLGTVSFPTSCSSAVQPVIEHGVALLHSFQYDEAAHGFDDAAHRDASCAMCHWGNAYQAPGRGGRRQSDSASSASRRAAELLLSRRVMGNCESSSRAEMRDTTR